MEPSRAVKEYKDEIEELKAKNDEYAKALGKVTIERDWLEKKLNSLDSLNKKELVESELKEISLTRQCELLNISRSSLYYIPKTDEDEIAIKNQIQAIYEAIPIYGYLKFIFSSINSFFSELFLKSNNLDHRLS
jgi:putative transposase